MTLTDDERKRFAEYCEAEAASYDMLARQSAKINGGEMLANPLRRKVAAFMVVANHLRESESMTLEDA